MAHKVIWTNRARTDLMDIYIQIGLEQTASAERMFDTIEQKVNSLAQHPRLGVRRQDIELSMRMLTEPPFVILYRTEPDSDATAVSHVEIVRIIDGRRDLSNLD